LNVAQAIGDINVHTFWPAHISLKNQKSSVPEITDPSDIIKALMQIKTKTKRILVPDLKSAKIGWDNAEKILRTSEENGIVILNRENLNYPKNLLHISNSPHLLHVKGNVKAISMDCIAIVGSRNPTEFGLDCGKKWASVFAEQGYVVVSGLALGIDTAAHQGALEAKGITIGVMANGLDSIYPMKNKELAKTILQNNGALISEYSWGVKSNQGSYIARNRIQSGLSLGVFVVETKIAGGTMQTVKNCKEQERTLIVMRHPSDILGKEVLGNNLLISENQADVVFESVADLDLVKEKFDEVKKRLLHSPKKSNDSNTKFHQTTLT